MHMYNGNQGVVSTCDYFTYISFYSVIISFSPNKDINKIMTAQLLIQSSWFEAWNVGRIDGT